MKFLEQIIELLLFHRRVLSKSLQDHRICLCNIRQKRFYLRPRDLVKRFARLATHLLFPNDKPGSDRQNDDD